ncbi:MAG: RNA methyltransferase [Bacteroidales bacterium]|nr:RNA methyltransferase [Bacteroidales bacterium]
MITNITSSKNQLIKNIIVLQTKSRERRKQDLIVIEGKKEISLAIAAGVEIKQVLFCPTIISYETVNSMFASYKNDISYFELSNEVFSKISYRETTGGIVVVAKTPTKNLQDLIIKGNSVFIILEAVEKPGNLGAVARIADGAGSAGIIICDSRTDIYNPNSIRASLGCVFTTNIVVAKTDDLLVWLKQNEIKYYAAELNASEKYHNLNLRGRIAVAFGTEATGLSKKMIDNADQRIKIPMLGQIDSLNVSASVAIIIYDAMRQRNFLG